MSQGKDMDVPDEPGVAVAEDGTGESQTSETRIEQSEPEAYTPEELVGHFREAAREVVREENVAFWNAMRKEVTPIQQVRSQLESLQSQLADVMGDAKESKALIKQVLRGETLDETQWAALEDAERLKAQQKADQAAQAEKARHEAELEAARQSQLTPERELAIRWGQLDEDMEEFAGDQGLKWDDIKGMRPTQLVVSQADPFGVKRARKEWRQAVLAKAGEREKEGNAEVSLPTVRGGGAQRETYADRLRDYSRPMPSPAEIDRETAKYLQR